MAVRTVHLDEDSERPLRQLVGAKGQSISTALKRGCSPCGVASPMKILGANLSAP